MVYALYALGPASIAAATTPTTPTRRDRTRPESLDDADPSRYRRAPTADTHGKANHPAAPMTVATRIAHGSHVGNESDARRRTPNPVTPDARIATVLTGTNPEAVAVLP